MNNEQRRWRFSLSSLMMAVLLVAIILAVLPYPMVGFYLILLVLFLSAVFARLGPPKQRNVWFSFALFGWLYVTLGVNFIEVFERSSQWFELRSWILNQGWDWYRWKPEHYLLAAHGLLSLLIATTGATLMSYYRSRQRAGVISGTEHSF